MSVVQIVCSHGETPTPRYVPFRNPNQLLDPSASISRPLHARRAAVGSFPVASRDGRYGQNVERATNDLFTDTLPAGLPFPLTRTRSSETIPVVTQTEIITVTDSAGTVVEESSTASDTGDVTSSASETRSSEGQASRHRTWTWTTSTTAASTTDAPAPTSSSPASSPPPLSTGATVGIVVGVVATLLVTVTISLSVHRCRKKKSAPEQEPLDKRLIGYPYPAPRFSRSFSRALAQTSGENVQQHAPRTEGETGDAGREEGSHVRDVSPDGRRAPAESDSLVAGYQQDQQNQGSRDTIRDILSAYSSASCYSQDGGVGMTSGPANNR